MRRRTTAMVAALGAVFALSGCGGLPPGVDGDLTNGWPATAEAKVVVPAAGACYGSVSNGVSAGDDTTTPCSTPHDLETVYVGAFTGADAQRSAPPSRGSQALVTVFADCRTNATAYLGDDFKLGLLDLSVVLPTVPAWNGGARWYRCDVARYRDLVDRNVVGQGSVKDGLRGDRPLALTCATVTDEETANITFTDEQPVACSQPHNAELAGLFTAPDVPWPADQTHSMERRGCEAVAARYLGESGGRVDNPVLGWAWDWFTEDRWKMGDRTVRCLLVGYGGISANGVRFTGSVKGIGTTAPK